MTADPINFDCTNFIAPLQSGVFCEQEAILIGLEALLRLRSSGPDAYLKRSPILPVALRSEKPDHSKAVLQTVLQIKHLEIEPVSSLTRK